MNCKVKRKEILLTGLISLSLPPVVEEANKVDLSRVKCECARTRGAKEMAAT